MIKVALGDFELLKVIGRGGYGKVYLARIKGEEKLYAIKAIAKHVLVEDDAIESTILEKNIMLECDHPFLMGMDYLYQNDQRLYFVMPFVQGGELYKIS